MKLYCCGCEDEVIPRLTTGEEIYPHRKDLYSLPFWICNSCGNYVGCHHKTDDSTRPLGSIPTPRIKASRQLIHRMLDPLWKQGKFSRSYIYQKLGEVLGREYHTADIRSLEEADVVVEYLKRI